MCTREMTLGEEIINLTKRGIDVPTVERMYRKYIDLDEKGKSEGGYAIDLGPLFPTFDIGDTVRYCRADVEATLNLFRDTVHNPYSILPADIKVGDKMMVPLGKLGNFTATVQKVTNNKVLFIFDDYVAKRPMNEDGGNAGGYSQSDLKKWIDTELYNMFPAVLKQRMTGLSIPTLGEICGWGDEWDRNHIEADGDEHRIRRWWVSQSQPPLMVSTSQPGPSTSCTSMASTFTAPKSFSRIHTLCPCCTRYRT